MPRRGGKRIKSRTHTPLLVEEEEGKLPKSFILRRGKTDKTIGTLVQDMRRMMSPYTASNLRTRKANNLKDFVAVAGPLGVTHCMLFTQTDKAVNLRVGRLPRGPSVTFRVLAYSLSTQVLASQRRPAYVTEAFRFPPIVVLSGFSGAAVAAAPERPGVEAVPPALAATGAAAAASSSSSSASSATSTAPGKKGRKGSRRPRPEDGPPPGEGWARALQLAATTLQHLFPPINVARVRLKECRRVVLFARDPETGIVEMRHFVIRARPAGLSRSVKKVVRPRHLPDLGALNDVADWVTGEGGDGYATSESEWEAGDGEVTLAQDVGGRGNRTSHQSVLRLSEVGPRLSLGLLRAEAELFGGEVLYHGVIRKTAEQAAELRRAHAERDALKKMRRAEQEANVARKTALAEAKKAAKAARKRARLEAEGEEEEGGYAGEEEEEDSGDEGEEGYGGGDVGDDDEDEPGAGGLGSEEDNEEDGVDDDEDDDEPGAGGLGSEEEDGDEAGEPGDLFGEEDGEDQGSEEEDSEAGDAVAAKLASTQRKRGRRE